MGEDKKLEVCKEQHRHHEKLIWAIVAFLGGAVVYAADWQRDQDAHMAKIDELSARQTALIEQQIEAQERFAPWMSYGYSPTRGVLFEREEPKPMVIPPHLGTISD